MLRCLGLLALFLVGEGEALAQGSWQRVEGMEWGPELELSRGEMRLWAADGELHRVRGGEEDALACTQAGGTGEVYDLARDVAGVEVVAAEHGVFVISREVEALDPLEPMAPLHLEGVRAVHADARRRLWFAGERGLGVLELAGQWGHRFTPEDLPEELRGCETFRIGPAPGKGLLVEGRLGGRRVAYRYLPDRGEGPRVEELLVNGEVWDAAQAVELTYPEGFLLEARGTGLGGARFRYRIDEHHVWRDLGEDSELARFSPGEHTLDVIAVDRDLVRSEPVRLTIRSAFPPRFDKRFVVVALGIFGALGLALFLRYERRRGWRPGALYRAPLSAGLLTVLTLQVLAGIEPHGKGWPFMGFSMYTTRFDEGDVIFESVLVGLQRNGGSRVIPPQAVGVAIDGRWQVLGPLVDRGDEVARQYLEAYGRRYPRSGVVGLQVRARRHRLTSEGAVEVAPQILSHYRAARGEPGKGEARGER